MRGPELSEYWLQKIRMARSIPLDTPPPRRRALRCELTPLEKRVIDLVEKGFSQTEIAADRGVTRQAVSGLCRSARRKRALLRLEP